MTEKEAREKLTELRMKKLEKEKKGEDTSVIDIKIDKIKREYAKDKLKQMQNESSKGYNK